MTRLLQRRLQSQCRPAAILAPGSPGVRPGPQLRSSGGDCIRKFSAAAAAAAAAATGAVANLAMAAAISNRRMATAGRQPPATDIERPAVNRNCSIELSARLLVILPDHVIMMDTAKEGDARDCEPGLAAAGRSLSGPESPDGPLAA